MSQSQTDVEKTMQNVQLEKIEHASTIDDHVHPQGTRKEYFPGITMDVILAFLAICTQLSAYEMALLVPASSISYIDAELGPSANSGWINVTWSLGAAVLVSISGRLADIFGRRYFMLCGALISFIGTIVGATGQSITQMIVSGVMMGVGSGFQEMGFACIVEFIPNKYRITALGLYGTCALPCLFTPLITYAFIAHTAIGWRGAYWMMTGWHGFGILCLFFFYHPPSFETLHKRESVSRLKMLAELDYVGLLLFTAGATLFLIGLNFGGRQYAWASAPVIAPIVVGFSCLVGLFIWVFNKPLKYPLLPPKLFRQWRGYNVLVVVGFCLGMLYYSMQVLWPRQSSLVYASAEEPIIRGVYANLTLMGTWLSLISVWVICSRLGHEKYQILFFVCVQTIFIGCLSTLEVSQQGKAVALVFLMSCFINQPLYLIFSMVSLNIEDQKDMGVAIGAMSTFRLLGGAVATAIYSSIATNQFAERLPKVLLSQLQGTGFKTVEIPSLLQAISNGTEAAFAQVPGITDTVIAAGELAVKLAYVQAFKVVYYTALGFALLAIISASLVADVDPAKKNMDRAVVLENEKRSGDEKNVSEAVHGFR